jgi:hypothetical protein
LTRYTAHAEKRMLERGVSKVEVEDTLAHPLEVRDTKHGRKAACGGRLDGGYTIVIFEADHEDLIVITAMKINSDGAKRYGFAGI